MRILLTGGGTGGHIFPLFTVAKEIKKIQQEQNPSEVIEFLFIGALNQSNKGLFDFHNIPAKAVLAGKLRRYFSIQNFLDLFRIVIGIFQSLWKVWIFMPDVIFSKGGYGSVPVVIAGWVYRIPIIIHDSDAIPGLANRFLSFFAKRIAVAFKEAARYFKDYQVAVTGNPIREDLLAGSKEKAKDFFHLKYTKPVLFVMGGSQGSKKINQAVAEIVQPLTEYAEIIHQTGEKMHKEILIKTQRLPESTLDFYHPAAFLKGEYKDALMAADLVLSRSGSSINEIAAMGKPSILIPLANSASGHQRENAYVFARAGASLVIEESNLTSNLLLPKIIELLKDKELLKAMGERAKKIVNPEAARLIAEEVIRLGKN